MKQPADRTKVDGAAGWNEKAPRTIAHPSDDWSSTFDAARQWVAWTARRRWPDFAANDDLWAMSVAAWWLGPRRGGRDA